jgi:RNA polymerase sigma factor (sigma-70 family)
MRPPFAFYMRLIKACLRRGRTLEDAEDLVQEAFLRLIEYQQAGRVRDTEAFLRRVIMNLSINLYNREQIVSFAEKSVEDLAETIPLIDSDPGPERVVAARQDVEQIATMLSHVSVRTSQIFIAHRAGYRYEEIAADLGISARTVKKHISRATALLTEATLEPTSHFYTITEANEMGAGAGAARDDRE